MLFFSRKVALCGRTANDWICEWVTRGQLEALAIVRDEGNPFFSRFSWKPVLQPLYILTTFVVLLLPSRTFFITCFFPCSCTYIHMWWFFPRCPMLWLLISRRIHNQQFRMKKRMKAYLSIFIWEARVGPKMKWRTNNKTQKH